MCSNIGCSSYVLGHIKKIKCDECIKSNRKLIRERSKFTVVTKGKIELAELLSRLEMVQNLANSLATQLQSVNQEIVTKSLQLVSIGNDKETLKRSLSEAQLEISNERIKNSALQLSLDEKPNRALASSYLKSQNAMLMRKIEILTHLYPKLSDFLDCDGKSIGFGLFCNIDIYDSDIGIYLMDFIGKERVMSVDELNGIFDNKYLLTVRKGWVFDCKEKAIGGICLASRCNQAAGLGRRLKMHLQIIYRPVPHLKIIGSCRAHNELLTSYNSNKV
jgi:hypothetical protein